MAEKISSGESTFQNESKMFKEKTLKKKSSKVKFEEEEEEEEITFKELLPIENKDYDFYSEELIEALNREMDEIESNSPNQEPHPEMNNEEFKVNHLDTKQYSHCDNFICNEDCPKFTKTLETNLSNLLYNCIIDIINERKNEKFNHSLGDIHRILNCVRIHPPTSFSFLKFTLSFGKLIKALYISLQNEEPYKNLPEIQKLVQFLRDYIDTLKGKVLYDVSIISNLSSSMEEKF